MYRLYPNILVKSKESDTTEYTSPAYSGQIPWRRKWQLTPVFLPEKSHGERSLAGYSPEGQTHWARITPLWKRTVLLVGRKEQCPAKKLCVFLGMRQSTEKLKLSAYTFKLLTINHPTQHKCQRLTYILVPDMSYGCNIYQAIEK